jgi:hypothetical protein
LRIHLTESAGLKSRRHHQKVGGRKHFAGLEFVKADVNADRTRISPRQIDDRALELGITAAGNRDLAACVDDRFRRLDREVDAFLMHQPRNDRE